ncbi:hypothetical protein ACI2OX_03575 [Bacillus sp. N9]
MSESILQQILTELQDVKAQMNLRFDTLETRMSNMETRMTGMETKMADMDTRMSGMETKMVDMTTKDDVADIPALKVAIYESLETSKRIEATQEKHERTLDLLSRRSIDQEAELKRIK